MASKLSNALSSADAAYIAGIIDGEGTISLTRRHRNENRQLEISVSNTDIALLQFLKHVSEPDESRKSALITAIIPRVLPT